MSFSRSVQIRRVNMETCDIFSKLERDPELMEWVETNASVCGVSVEEFVYSVLCSALSATEDGQKRVSGMAFFHYWQIGS